jgi:hypothetical protein
VAAQLNRPARDHLAAARELRRAVVRAVAEAKRDPQQLGR